MTPEETKGYQLSRFVISLCDHIAGCIRQGDATEQMAKNVECVQSALTAALDEIERTRARAEKAEADLPRIRAERDAALDLIAKANADKEQPEESLLKRRLDERNRHKEIARRAWDEAISAAQQLAHEWLHNSGHGSPADEIATLKKGENR